MIKRIKYGCFALLFITTLTLSSIVAILASSNANIDNSFYLTYEAPPEVELCNGSTFARKIKNDDYDCPNTNIRSFTFDYYSEDYTSEIAGAERSVSVANDGSEDAVCYLVADGSFYDCYILSESKMVANQNCDSMFMYFQALVSLTFNNFDTKNTTTMHWMFRYCTSLVDVDISYFNTQSVTDFSNMFAWCEALQSINMSGINIQNLNSTNGMFAGCSKLTTIYVDNSWSSDGIINSNDMFNSCTSLVGGNGTIFNSSYTDATYARIDTAETPGYFTRKTA